MFDTTTRPPSDAEVEKLLNPHPDSRKEKRLAIAISLLKGKLIDRPRPGYDPGGFYTQQVDSLVSSALDIAEELIVQNEAYDSDE